MSDDDLLRSALERDVRSVPIRHDAHDVLAALEPALRRATIKRTSLIAASTVLVLGGSVAAFNAARPTEDGISIDSPVTVTSEPETTDTIRTGSVDGGTAVPTTLDDDSTIPSPIEVSGDEGPDSAPPPPTPSSSAPIAPTTAARPGGVDPTPAPAPEPRTPPVASPTTPPTTTSTPTPPAPSTAPASGEQITRYDSACGSVIADLATEPPTIVEIVVTTGYRYRIEDPDGNSITVQFTGPGEDCEVKVGAHDDASHTERSETDDSSDDESSASG